MLLGIPQMVHYALVPALESATTYLKMATGLHLATKQTYSLSVMRKRGRGNERKSGRKKARTKDYDYMVNPAPYSFLSSIPDSLVDNIPSHSMDPEKGGDEENSDSYDVIDLSKVPPQTDTHLVGCSNNFDYSVCNTLSLSVDPEKEGDTKHNDSNDVIDLSKLGARKEDYTHQFSNVGSLSETSPQLSQGSTANKTEAPFAPWMHTQSIIHDWSKVSPKSQCLSPKLWLEGETIEQAIAAFIQQEKMSDSILCVPTYLYQLAALGTLFQFFAANRVLNYDALIIPFNTDISGSGCHWLLAIANFREQEISVFNSNHSLETVKLAAPTLMKVISCVYIYVSAGENLQASGWRVTDVVNASQQDNGYDCVVFVVVNVCAIISHFPLGPVNSLKARLWIHPLIQKYEAPKSKRSGLSQEKLLSYNKKRTDMRQSFKYYL